MSRARRLLAAGAMVVEKGAMALGAPFLVAGQAAKYARLRFGAFVPRPGDVFIASYPKSGTTWMQVIVHHLLHGPDAAYEHIDHVVPWLEQKMVISGSAAFTEEMTTPRAFKTHLRYAQLRPPPDSRCIYLVRNVYDTAVSHFYHESFLLDGSASFDEFFKTFLRNGFDRMGGMRWGTWFDFQRSWWPHRHDPNVLFVRYEEMVRDTRGVVARVAAFCGLSPTEAELDAVLERSSFAFMKRNGPKFDPRLSSRNAARSEGFIRKGGIATSRGELTDAHRAELARRLAALREELSASPADLDESAAPSPKPPA